MCCLSVGELGVAGNTFQTFQYFYISICGANWKRLLTDLIMNTIDVQAKSLLTRLLFCFVLDPTRERIWTRAKAVSTCFNQFKHLLTFLFSWRDFLPIFVEIHIPQFSCIPTTRAKTLLPQYIERGLLNAGLRPDPAADARRDPSGVPNATSSTRPWVIHRFARPNVSPHICLQLDALDAIKRCEF